MCKADEINRLVDFIKKFDANKEFIQKGKVYMKKVGIVGIGGVASYAQIPAYIEKGIRIQAIAILMRKF